jgi:hypothetical protein
LFFCAPVTLLRCFEEGILEFGNYELSIDQIKSIACVIPLIKGLRQIKFENNHLTDPGCCLIIIAAFMHP